MDGYREEREAEAMETDEAAGQTLWLAYTISVGVFMGTVTLVAIVGYLILILRLSL